MSKQLESDMSRAPSFSPELAIALECLIDAYEHGRMSLAPETLQSYLNDHGHPIALERIKKMLSPYTIEHEGRVVLQRAWYYETFVASNLASRAKTEGSSSLKDTPHPPARRKKLRSNSRLSPEQEAVVHACAKTRLIVLTGGPGTGKTTTLSSMLRYFLDSHTSASHDSSVQTDSQQRVLVLAPTGKAVRRLKATIAFEDDDSSLELSFQTVHAALGFRDRAFMAPRAHFNSKLDADLCVIDEASMLDNELLAHMLSALPMRSALWLVGDPDQLPPVGPGTPFLQLVDAAREMALRPTYYYELTTNFRRRKSFDIAGDTYQEKGSPGLSLANLSSLLSKLPPRRRDELKNDTKRHASASLLFFKLDDHWELEELLQTFMQNCGIQRDSNAWRTLCVTYEGGLGVHALQQAWKNVFAGQDDRVGDPIFATKALRDFALENGAEGRLVLKNDFMVGRFESMRGEEVDIPWPHPGLQKSWVSSVHKAQGSEYEHVIFFLPDFESPLLTPRLVYTALTRARRQTWIVSRDGIYSMSSDRNEGELKRIESTLLSDTAGRVE